MNHAIEMKNVRQSYSHFKINDFNLTVPQGTIFGIIGANGAGKSTLLRILMGLIRPDAGDVVVLGHSMPKEESIAKAKIGFASEDMRLYDKATLAKHIEWMKIIFPSWDDSYAAELIDRFRLIPSQLIKGLSHGQRVKAMMLLALARKPQLLLLDEPTTGLDPVARSQINRELTRVMEDENRTVVLSSQNTQDVEQICDYITFIDDGRIIAADDRDAFLDRWKRIRFEGQLADKVLPKIEGLQFEQLSRLSASAVCESFDESLKAKLEASGLKIKAVERMTLEEIFVNTVNREFEAAR